MALISLIHPSRGRSKKAKATLHKWIENSNSQVEHILSLDSDDDIKSYLPEGELMIGFDLHNESNTFWWSKGSIITGPNKSVVEATNRAAKESKGDILIYLSDDFDCPDNWGPFVLKEFEGVEGPLLLKVDDCLQAFHVPVLTIPIMNRALYERLNYFWHPEYKSMFCDQDLFEVCKKNGWLKLAPHLKFPHNHVSVGKAENDETYRRSAANWEQGRALFARRKQQGFPV